MNTATLDRVEHKTGALRLRGALARMHGSNIPWDTDNPSSLAICEDIWRQSARYGLMFYDGQTTLEVPRAERVRGFDPQTAPAETVIFAPMAGG